MTIDKVEVKKILIIKFRGIGDVALACYTLGAIKTNFPNAKIHFMSEGPSKPLLENIPLIDEVLIAKLSDKLSTLKLIRAIRKEKYDLIFDFYTNPRSALITFLSGAKYRAGFPYKGRKYAYNLFGPEERNLYHSATLHFKMLENCGIKLESTGYEVVFDKTVVEKSQKMIAQLTLSEFYIVVPGGGWQSKRCDPVKFAQFIDFIYDKYQIPCLIVWGPGDLPEAVEIEKLANSKPVLAPKTDIVLMMSLFKQSKFVISNDSGPMHLAASVGAPVLGLFGPTSPKMHGPYGSNNEWFRNEKLDCIECNLLQCPKNHECFLEMELNEFENKLNKFLKKNGII